jgi:hypothetical protein
MTVNPTRVQELLSEFYWSRDTAGHSTAPGDLQQVGFHVDDHVFAVPVAGEEVFFQAIGLEPDGAVDELVLVGAGVRNKPVLTPGNVSFRHKLRRSCDRKPSLSPLLPQVTVPAVLHEEMNRPCPFNGLFCRRNAVLSSC